MNLLSIISTIFNWFGKSQILVEENKIIDVVLPIDIIQGDGTPQEDVLALINYVYDFSQIDKKLAIELGLYSPEQVVDRVAVEIEGKEKLAEQIEVRFIINGDWQTSKFVVVDRADEKQLVVLGKNDLRGYLIRIPE